MYKTKSKPINYYDILRIDPLATTSDIKNAIKRSKGNGVNQLLSDRIDQMEEILLDSVKRNEYNRAHGLPELRSINRHKAVNDDFADVDGESIIKQQLRNLPHHSRDKKKEIEESSVMSSDGQLRLKMQKASKTTLMIFFGFCVVLVMFVISKPLTNYYFGISQSKKAMEAITVTVSQVESFIRKEKYFPDRVNLKGIPSEKFFDLRLEANRQRIVLTFNENASTHLQGNFITNSYITPPNTSYWRCDISGNFPKRFKPVGCF